jgi:hypothetical protein
VKVLEKMVEMHFGYSQLFPGSVLVGMFQTKPALDFPFCEWFDSIIHAFEFEVNFVAAAWYCAPGTLVTLWRFFPTHSTLRALQVTHLAEKRPIKLSILKGKRTIGTG